MGAFGGGKTVSISSVVYNLAGPEEDRPDYLQTTVVSKVIAVPNKQSLTEHLVQSYLTGPGIKLRNFGRWARLYGYNTKVGMTPGKLAVGDSFDPEVVEGEIPAPPGASVRVTGGSIGSPDYTWWVDQYVADNHPELLGTEYESDFDEGTNTVTITFEDTSVETFHPAGFNPYGGYLYANYLLRYDPVEGPIVPGTPVMLGELDPWPSLTGWTELSYTETPTDVTLTTTVHTLVEYSDSTPNEEDTETTTSDETYDVISGSWEKTEYMGQHPTVDATYSLKSTMSWTQTGSVSTSVDTDVTVEDLGGGVTKTTTVTTTTETLVLNRSYQIDTQELIDSAISTAKIFIYEFETGNEILDALFYTPESFGEFFPFIPFRIDNQFVSPSWFGSDYPWCQKAVRKLMGPFTKSYDDLIELIADNDSLGDIDYAYACFGVPLNTKENAALRYVYEFFLQIMFGQSMGSSQLSAWNAQYVAAKESQEAWWEWKQAQSDPLDPLFGTPEPSQIPYPPPPGYSITVASGSRTDLNFNMRLHWAAVDETISSGVLDSGKKAGDLWFTKIGTESFDQSYYSGGVLIPGTSPSYERIRLNWQVDNDTWRTLDIWGLNHQNFIYGGRAVTTYAFQALDDEDTSGMIVPLHEEIFRSMPLIEATQMSTACLYMVFNCYTVNKEKWYETTLFKILIVVIAIALSIWTGGSSLGLAGGILGSNAAIGAALGFTGVVAAIAGAIANAVAAMIVTQILSYVGQAVFGEQVGAIVGVIASIIAIQVGTNFAMGGSITDALTSLMQPENLARVTMSVGDGYSQFVQAQAQQTLAQAQDLMNQYAEQSREIQQWSEELFGSNRLLLDPLTLTNANVTSIPESPQTFLSRTLMTGSDICEASHDILSNFAELSVNTTLPG